MRNPEYFYEKTAKQLGEDEDLVTKANKFFWKYGIKEAIRAGETPILYVKGLGTFYSSPKRLREEILKKIAILRFVILNKKQIPQEKVNEIVENMRKQLSDLLKLKSKSATQLNTVKQRKKLMNEQVA